MDYLIVASSQLQDPLTVTCIQQAISSALQKSVEALISHIPRITSSLLKSDHQTATEVTFSDMIRALESLFITLLGNTNSIVSGN